jgi:hypothetical protein
MKTENFHPSRAIKFKNKQENSNLVSQELISARGKGKKYMFRGGAFPKPNTRINKAPFQMPIGQIVCVIMTCVVPNTVQPAEISVMIIMKSDSIFLVDSRGVQRGMHINPGTHSLAAFLRVVRQARSEYTKVFSPSAEGSTFSTPLYFHIKIYQNISKGGEWDR